MNVSLTVSDIRSLLNYDEMAAGQKVILDGLLAGHSEVPATKSNPFAPALYVLDLIRRTKAGRVTSSNKIAHIRELRAQFLDVKTGSCLLSLTEAKNIVDILVELGEKKQ